MWLTKFESTLRSHCHQEKLDSASIGLDLHAVVCHQCGTFQWCHFAHQIEGLLYLIEMSKHYLHHLYGKVTHIISFLEVNTNKIMSFYFIRTSCESVTSSTHLVKFCARSNAFAASSFLPPVIQALANDVFRWLLDSLFRWLRSVCSCPVW